MSEPKSLVETIGALQDESLRDLKKTFVPRFDVPVPPSMNGLARDHRGYIVPRFVAFLRDRRKVPYGSPGAEPDFRAIDTDFFIKAMNFHACWLCGRGLGRYHVFAIGPMCAVNRITSEPASHRDCAHYAVKVCPFMIEPRMRRNETAPDSDAVRIDPAGFHNPRNPGVMLLWTQIGPARPFEAGHGDKGVLLKLGEPDKVEWWTRGRFATREEANHALTAGVEELMKLAKRKDGPEGEQELLKLAARAERFLPR